LERRRLAAVLARIIALPHPVALAMETPRFGDAAPAVTLIAGMPMALLAGAAGDARRAALKRALDVILAGLALAALAPALVTCAAALRLERAGPVLQRDLRYGRNNAAFAALSFRKDTAFGGLLQRLGLDGLPLLFNVVRGEMALVGPEARLVGLLVDGVDPFTRLCDYAYRHRVRPGLTGLAQVNGLCGARGGLKRFEAALALDLDYVRRYDLLLDLRIMLQALSGAIGAGRTAG
jgi:lipopolysaccharide/colanic/teichoic acid biosynthesis glycosyltransferase